MYFIQHRGLLTASWKTPLLLQSNSSILHLSRLPETVQPTRGLVIKSRRDGVKKSVKAVRKRFIPTKCPYTGLETFKRLRGGLVHGNRKKSTRRKFKLRGMVLVRNASQIKTLKKMYGKVYRK